MPVLKDFRRTKKVDLSKYVEGAEVEVYNSVLVKDGDNLARLTADKENFDQLCESLLLLIKGWNFTDESGHPLTVTKDALKELTIDCLLFIVNEAKDFDGEAKKKIDA